MAPPASSSTPDLGAITPEDLEIARQAARAVKAFTRIYEVASLFAEIVTRLDTRQRELAALDAEAGRKREKLQEVATEILAIRDQITRETTALAHLRERSATAERDAGMGVIQLQREHAVAMDHAKVKHQNALRQLDEAQAARVKALDEEYRGKLRRAAEALGLIEAKLTAAEAEARQTAERLVGP